MAILTALMTHHDASLVEGQLSYLRSLAPDSRFVVCHGGQRAEFEKLAAESSLFIDDPSLRGPSKGQSYNAVLTAVYEHFTRDDPAVDLIYFIEYDHLILRGDFEGALIELAERTEAGLMTKWGFPRNDTNWPHFLRFRHDDALNRFFAGISRRDEPDQRWGCLASGMLFRRDALGAFCSVAGLPSAYSEMFIPTLVYHLGFEVADIDALSDLYGAVRWRPNYSVDEALREKRAGRTFVHPFKELGSLDVIRDAPAATLTRTI